MQNGIELFDGVIKENIIVNKKFLLKRGKYIPVFARLGRKMEQQSKIRREALQNENVVVPPIMIISITNDCNLNCAGCYACAQDRAKEDEISLSDIDRTIKEAEEMGVAIIMIAGGEPLVKKGILDVLAKYEDMLFVIFTNGLMIRGETLDKIKRMKNALCAISIEGGREATDKRRGEGVYDKISESMAMLDENGVLFGTSITLTKANFDQVVNSAYLKSIQDMGASVTFMIEYVPCQGDEELCLTEEQKADLINKMPGLSKEMDMLLIPLPGEEDKYGGCLAAGRGFLHISSTGSLEACPFAPYSDANIKDMHLKEALKSHLLKKVRDNHHMLKEGKGGCTLAANKEWVESIYR
ncbi:MAG: radical SAM protein [Clostridia bacterium]|nr:radical SAM protein [Clostridia bacterium]